MTDSHAPRNPRFTRRAICPTCGKAVAIGMPRLGDGSADAYRRHKDHSGEVCAQSRQLIDRSRVVILHDYDTPESPEQYIARKITEVVRDGSWKSLCPLPIDGYVLAASRSGLPGSDHHVQMYGRYVGYCSGPCNGHPVTCFHRIQGALASWRTEHPDWRLEALLRPDGSPLASLVYALVVDYLHPPEREVRRFRLKEAAGPEVRHATL